MRERGSADGPRPEPTWPSGWQRWSGPKSVLCYAYLIADGLVMCSDGLRIARRFEHLCYPGVGFDGSLRGIEPSAARPDRPPVRMGTGCFP
jgi:hypothetical protein